MSVRRKWLYVGAACACVAGLSAATALADATITRDDRYLEFSADATDFGGSTTGALTSHTPTSFAAAFNLGGGYDIIRPSGAAEAHCVADQLSSLNGATTFSTLSATGNADVNGNTEFDGISSQAFAESNFEIDFSLAMPHTFTLTGQLDTFSSGTTVRAKLFAIGGADYYAQTTEGVIDSSGLLPVGDYTLQLLARSNRSVLDGAFYNSDAAYENVVLQLSAVPEPASLALLALGALALVRRR